MPARLKGLDLDSLWKCKYLFQDSTLLPRNTINPLLEEHWRHWIINILCKMPVLRWVNSKSTWQCEYYFCGSGRVEIEFFLYSERSIGFSKHINIYTKIDTDVDVNVPTHISIGIPQNENRIISTLTWKQTRESAVAPSGERQIIEKLHFNRR
jgi:hypothetical protein